MRILLVGDIVGRPGKHACSQIIPALIRDREIGFVVANAENTCAGSGLTPAMFRKLLHYGIDVCTMGDHIYKRREIVPVLNQSEHIVRPANLPPEAAGRELTIVTSRQGIRVAVISLLGRIFMNMRSECPFHTVDRLLTIIPPDVKIILVDFHAEATSEKIALGWHLDGRATAVVGTHTHVQTADERILPGGTAYITDLGMSGPHDSVLGRDKRAVIENLITTMPIPYAVATGEPILHGAIVECDSTTGRAISIERISIREDSPIPAGEDD